MKIHVLLFNPALSAILCHAAGTPESDSDNVMLMQSTVTSWRSSNSNHRANLTAGQVSAEKTQVNACRAWQMFYGLGALPSSSPQRFRVNCSASLCGLSLPQGMSQFVGNKLPTIIAAEAIQDLLSLSLPVARTFEPSKELPLSLRKSTFNPSIVQLPSHMRAHFPNGHFLAVVHSFYVGSILAVLDKNLAVISKRVIDVRNGLKDLNILFRRRILADAHVLLRTNGDALIRFTPYILLTNRPAGDKNKTRWGCSQLFAPLHLKVSSAGRLHGWVDVPEIRKVNMKNWADQSMCIKNIGLIDRASKGILALNSIYPTVLFNLSQEVSSAFAFSTDRGGPSSKPALADHSEQAQLWSSPILPIQQFHVLQYYEQRVQPAFLHNGPNPIWIDELQEYLGVGHFKRGAKDIKIDSCNLGKTFGHHYTHLFFTLSKELPSQLKRIGATEFCMASLERRKLGLEGEDCDTIQFVSGVVRDGDKLLLTYGVMDSHSRVATLNVSSVLESLKAVDAGGAYRVFSSLNVVVLLFVNVLSFVVDVLT